MHTVTEAKQRKVVGILRDDCIATLKRFLSEIPAGKAKEVCIDIKDDPKKMVGVVFPLVGVVVDLFHVIADSNRRMNEARRIEQDVYRKRRVEIPKKIFLVDRERLSKDKGTLPTTKLLENIIFNLKSADGTELIRWGTHQDTRRSQS